MLCLVLPPISTGSPGELHMSLISMQCNARSTLPDFPGAGVNRHLAKCSALSDGVPEIWRVWKRNKRKTTLIFDGVTFLTTATQDPLWVTVSLAGLTHSALPQPPSASSLLLSIWCRQRTVNYPVSAGIWMLQPSDWCRKWNEHLGANRHSGSANCPLAAFGKQSAVVARWGRAGVIAGSQLIHAQQS